MIVGTIIGMEFLVLPRAVASAAAQDAWIAVLIGASLPLLSLVLIERLGRLFPEMDFMAMSQLLFGKVAGSLLVVGLVLHMLVSAALVANDFVSVDSVYMLPHTPRWMIGLLIILVSVYVAGQGAKVVGRLNELLFYLYLPSLLLLIPALLTVADYTNIMPVGGAGTVSLAKGSVAASLWFGRMEFLLVAYFMVVRRDEVLKAGRIAVAWVAGSYVLVTMACLLVYGPDGIGGPISPLLGILKTTSYPVLERMDSLFMVVYSVAFRPVFNLLCMSSFSFTRLVNLPERKHYLMVLAVLGAIVYLLTLIPRRSVDALTYTSWVQYGYLLFGLGYPLLYHLAAAIQRGKVHHV